MPDLYVPDTNLPQAIIFDIDGTLAHMTDRGPFDWKRVGTDSVDEIVREMLFGFQDKGYNIVIMSGRDSICRQETHNWLWKWDICYDLLCMRPERDYRKDSIVKEELFYNYVAPYYNVLAVVDDRPQVVRMWYEIGIPKVICVGNPWLEF